jgi:hypothetical protein
VPDLTDLSVLPTDDTYDAALNDLAHSLVRVWAICEAGYDEDRGLGTIGNLPEALSYALGLAAAALGLDRDADGTLIDDDRSRELAAEALVRHRPGSWEAEHVRTLTFPPYLIPREAA